MAVSFEGIAIGNTYSRRDLAQAWGYGGVEALSRGVVTPRDDNKIILFVTQHKRPDDAQYDDELVSDVLLWEGPNDHFAEDRLVRHNDTRDEVHLFFRAEHRSDFIYLGEVRLHCCERCEDRPSRFVFRVPAVER